MKSDYLKYVLIAIMVIGLGMTFVFTENRRNDEKNTLIEKALDKEYSEKEGKEIKESPNKSSNTGFSIMQEDSGLIRINGNGKLTNEIFGELLFELGVEMEEVSHVSIEGEIEEIGYKVLDGYTYLETLRVGKNVKAINNGAVINCPVLQYVFLPSGLKRVGRDFLFNCDYGLCVVTDKSRDDIPRLWNLNEDHIIDNIDSYEKMEKALNETPIGGIFTSSQLYSTDPDAGKNPMKVRPGYTQYGPYIFMKAGNYIIRIYGENFSELSESMVYYKDPPARGEKNNLSITDTLITYEAIFSNDNSDVEFVISNPEDSASVLSIDRIEIIMKDRMEIYKAVLTQWWNQE